MTGTFSLILFLLNGNRPTANVKADGGRVPRRAKKEREVIPLFKYLVAVATMAIMAMMPTVAITQI